MKVLMICLFRSRGEAPVRLASVQDLSGFNFFTRTTIGEHLLFATRLVAQKTASGTRQSIEMNDNPFLCHCYARGDGLVGIVVCDKEYPQRVAFTLVNKTMSSFDEEAGAAWGRVDTDQSVQPEFMKSDLVAFQDPQNADKLMKIQMDLIEIKDIMQHNIDELIKRGETLDSLMQKSKDLSETSLKFYRQAKKKNQCCKAY